MDQVKMTSPKEKTGSGLNDDGSIVVRGVTPGDIDGSNNGSGTIVNADGGVVSKHGHHAHGHKHGHGHGHEELERNFSFLSSLGMAFSMLNSWVAMAASLQLVLPSGGPVAMVWGLVVSALGSLAMASSLAEICHVYPSSGGQYHWAYLLAPERWRRGLAFYTGWMATAGWIAVTATGSSLGANFITGLIALWQPNYVAQPYQTFLLYLAFTVGSFFLNAFAVKLLPLVDRAAFFWSLSGIVVVIITLLATAKGAYEPASFVFGEFVNQTGWPGGAAFLLGLLQSTFGLTGFDAISHMQEEMPILTTESFALSQSINAPRVMVMAVILGSSTAWVFIVVCLFTLNDFQGVIDTTYGPLLEIYYQATSSKVGATCLLMFNLGAMAFATQALMTVASRMVLSSARDDLFGRFSKPLAIVNPKLKVPLLALVFTNVWVIVFGLIFLGSSAALNAILSASVVFLQFSYVVPIALVLFRGRKVLEPPGSPKRILTLGPFRPVVNIFALIFAIVTCVFFCFPGALPVTGVNMNYVVVVLAIVFLMMGITWLVDGRKNYRGPINVEMFEREGGDGVVDMAKGPEYQ